MSTEVITQAAKL